MTHLGLIVAIGGHADAAIEAFDKAAAIDPAYAPIYLYRGHVLYEAKQDYPGAVKAWERFLALVPDRRGSRPRGRARQERAGAVARPALDPVAAPLNPAAERVHTPLIPTLRGGRA